jgi:pilus assembly protein CpaE
VGVSSDSGVDTLTEHGVGLKVTVVGGQDRELDAALRGCGAMPNLVPMAEFAALAQPSAKQPDVIVVDLRGHAGVPPALAALKRQHAATPVIIIAKSLDPELMLSAMRAGANECLAEPVSQGDLDAALTRVAARQAAPAASQSFAIVGVKGGVGATSLAVNVATSLARVASAGALLVDLHVARGEAALYLGIEPRFTVVDALDNIQKLDDAFFRSLIARAPSSRLELLASPDAAGPARLDQSRVRTLLDFTSKMFEFTVVDVPRTEPAALDALDGMKSIVVVMTQEVAAVRSAAAMMNRLRQRYGKERPIVVLNAKENHSDVAREDIEQVIGAPVAYTIPCDPRTSLDALNKGRPIVLDNHNNLAGSFEKFARSLAGLKKAEKAEAQTGGGWLNRLTGRK